MIYHQYESVKSWSLKKCDIFCKDTAESKYVPPSSTFLPSLELKIPICKYCIQPSYYCSTYWLQYLLYDTHMYERMCKCSWLKRSSGLFRCGSYLSEARENVWHYSVRERNAPTNVCFRYHEIPPRRWQLARISVWLWYVCFRQCSADSSR